MDITVLISSVSVAVSGYNTTSDLTMDTVVSVVRGCSPNAWIWNYQIVFLNTWFVREDSHRGSAGGDGRLDLTVLSRGR